MYKVLIVDDEERIRKGLETIIDWAAHGCEICGTANNGRNGIIEAKLLNPDLIITDILMPGIDGIQMIEQLQEEGFYCQCLILSGVKDFNYAKRAIDLKVAAYLLKPVQRDELMQKVSELFNYVQHGESMHEIPNDIIRRVTNYIEEFFCQPLLLNIIASELHYSAPYLGRVFKKAVGVSFNQYVHNIRMEKAKAFIQEGHKIYVVTKMTGYRNVDYFTEKFKNHTGMTPSEYRISCTKSDKEILL